eukprot:COSAG02_NODE_6255_length_3695_cov_16.449291_1_plen_61_part_00
MCREEEAVQAVVVVGTDIDPAEATAPQERALGACLLLVQHGDRLGRLGEGGGASARACVL